MRHPYKTEEAKQKSLSNLTKGRAKPHCEETKSKIKEAMRAYWDKRRNEIANPK